MNNNVEKIYWGHFFYRDWKIYLAVTDKGLCKILLPNESFNNLESWVTRYFPEASLIHDKTKLAHYILELEEYFSSKRKTFDFPLELKGTNFQRAVWKALLKIPYGTTKSYQDIAKEINRPKAVRAVGAANRANPLPIVVPCHRVIGKDGNLTGFRGGLKLKEALLKLEGFNV